MHTPDLTSVLIAGQNPDGGWGYYLHKTSRLEPTCWAVLGLAAAGRLSEAGAALCDWPSRNGLLLERPGGEPNYAFHGLALLALNAAALEHRGRKPVAGRGPAAGERARTRTIPD